MFNLLCETAAHPHPPPPCYSLWFSAMLHVYTGCGKSLTSGCHVGSHSSPLTGGICLEKKKIWWSELKWKTAGNEDTRTWIWDKGTALSHAKSTCKHKLCMYNIQCNFQRLSQLEFAVISKMSIAAALPPSTVLKNCIIWTRKHILSRKESNKYTD